MWDATLEMLAVAMPDELLVLVGGGNGDPLNAHGLKAAALLFWLPLLKVKLYLVDRRDTLTALDYVAYGIGSGTILLWGIPAALGTEATALSKGEHAAWLSVLIGLSAWNYLRVKTNSAVLEAQRLKDGER